MSLFFLTPYTNHIETRNLEICVATAKFVSSIKLLHLELDILTVDLDDVEDFEDSHRVDSNADEPEVESLSMVFRKDLTLINLQ